MGHQPRSVNHPHLAAQVEQCSGVAQLMTLQQHQRSDIAAKASSIVLTYFGAADEKMEE